MTFSFSTLRPRNPELVLRRGISGFGIFTKAPLKKNVFLMEYGGPRLTDAEVEQKGGRYLFEVRSGVTIDGSSRKNFARYSNHSCDPNAEARIVRGRILIFSLRKIAKDEEIAFDYGKEYVEAFIAPHGCRCASCVKKSRERV